MIRQKIFIDKYGWLVDILYDAKPRDANEIIDRLADMGCAMRHLVRAEDLLLSGIPNQGLTYTDHEERHTLIAIGHATTVGAMLNTISHELNHAVDHISQHFGIPLSSEENAYLSGDVAELIWNDAIRIAAEIWNNIR